jgi:AcrR family transcriptional regulator
VLEAATAVFATEGTAVPIHEIARRAGVGVGTVGRHFPTKEALFDAIVLERARRITEQAQVLREDPGEAFFQYFSIMVAEGATNRGLAEALGGIGYDMGAAAQRGGYDILGTLGALLEQAQAVGAVRPDVGLMDVKALLQGCLAREREAIDDAARERMIAIVCAGLRPGQR